MILTLLKCLPRKKLSRLTGQIVHAERPKWFARWLRAKLIRSLKIDPSDAEFEVEAYPSFGKFFARKLKDGARPIDSAKLISPCDGKLVAQGRIQEGLLYQCKGKMYALRDLLRRDDYVDLFQDGYFMTLYLAPHNYHRVHMPMDGSLINSLYISGDLWPVNAGSVQKIEKLFCINERCISVYQTKYGAMAMIMVGATNVGSIELSHFPADIKMDELSEEWFTSFEPPLEFQKGQEHGIFHMGSTVILLFSKTMAEKFEKSPASEGPVQFGQRIFDL